MFEQANGTKDWELYEGSVNAACDQTLQFFSRGEHTGHHGRRRLLNLLSDRTILPRGQWLHRGLSVEFTLLHCVFCCHKTQNVTSAVLKTVLRTLIGHFSYCIFYAKVVQSVTVGPRYGTRFFPKSSVFGLAALYVRVVIYNTFTSFFFNRRPSKWRVKMFSS